MVIVVQSVDASDRTGALSAARNAVDGNLNAGDGDRNFINGGLSSINEGLSSINGGLSSKIGVPMSPMRTRGIGGMVGRSNNSLAISYRSKTKVISEEIITQTSIRNRVAFVTEVILSFH